jgi:protein-S-isoprenylcysteine O-methyltransferase Ste14
MIDLPPIWLAAFVAVVFALGRLMPLPVFGAAGDAVAILLVVAGIVLTTAAALQMMQARTTVIPHRQPQALVTGGVFRLSRNPIYLADAGFLLAAILWFDALLALPLLPVFIWLIQRRFILPEEARLRAGFGTGFEAWAGRVRRWI